MSILQALPMETGERSPATIYPPLNDIYAGGLDPVEWLTELLERTDGVIRIECTDNGTIGFWHNDVLKGESDTVENLIRELWHAQGSEAYMEESK